MCAAQHSFVLAGLDAAIQSRKFEHCGLAPWMAGSSPAKTKVGNPAKQFIDIWPLAAMKAWRPGQGQAAL